MAVRPWSGLTGRKANRQGSGGKISIAVCIRRAAGSSAVNDYLCRLRVSGLFRRDSQERWGPCG